jgi:hypothetical protein
MARHPAFFLYSTMSKLKIAALVVLFGVMLGLAWDIERKARPMKNVTVTTQHGEHEH